MEARLLECERVESSDEQRKRLLGRVDGEAEEDKQACHVGSGCNRRRDMYEAFAGDVLLNRPERGSAT